MIYDYLVKKSDGSDLKLSDFKGKVIMVVNTATGCGFTPQYAPIEQMYKDYHEKGLEILDIPCNQFGAQAPGSDKEIHEFCQLHYNTTFEQMKKADVNGENELPLYKFLKSQKGFKGFGDGSGGEMVIGEKYLLDTIAQASGARQMEARLATLEALVADGFNMVANKTLAIRGQDLIYANRGNINRVLGAEAIAGERGLK